MDEATTRTRRTVIRGVTHRLRRDSGGDCAIHALFLALLALDDPRVDRVFRDLGVVFHDARGEQAWPPPVDPDDDAIPF